MKKNKVVYKKPSLLKRLQRKITWMILNRLPQDVIEDYACDRMELMCHDAWQDNAAGAAEARRG